MILFKFLYISCYDIHKYDIKSIYFKKETINIKLLSYFLLN